MNKIVVYGGHDIRCVGLPDDQSGHIHDAVQIEIERGIAQLAIGKSVFRDSVVKRGAVAKNGYRVIASVQADYQRGIFSDPMANTIDVDDRNQGDRRPVADLSKTDMRFPRRPKRKYQLARPWKPVSSFRTRTVLERYSGIVDVLEEDTFQVTLNW